MHCHYENSDIEYMCFFQDEASYWAEKMSTDKLPPLMPDEDKNLDAALQAHFFKKLPFGDLQLKNGRHKTKFSCQKEIEGEEKFMTYYTKG